MAPWQCPVCPGAAGYVRSGEQRYITQPKASAKETWLLTGVCNDDGGKCCDRLEEIEEDWLEEAAEAAASEPPGDDQ